MQCLLGRVLLFANLHEVNVLLKTPTQALNSQLKFVVSSYYKALVHITVTCMNSTNVPEKC